MSLKEWLKHGLSSKEAELTEETMDEERGPILGCSGEGSCVDTKKWP